MMIVEVVESSWPKLWRELSTLKREFSEQKLDLINPKRHFKTHWQEVQVQVVGCNVTIQNA